MINMCSSEWSRVIERECSEKVLFLFVFLFKLFIHDVEEVRFFVFTLFRDLATKKKVTVHHSLEGKRIASLIRRPNSPTPERMTMQAGFVYFFFLFLSTNARCAFESRFPPKCGHRGVQEWGKIASFPLACAHLLPHTDMDSFSSRDCISSSDLIKETFRVCCANTNASNRVRAFKCCR